MATPTDWPIADDRPPRAGVSGFGWSGTNAHVVLEGYRNGQGADGQSPGHWNAGQPRSIAVSQPDSVPESTSQQDRLARRGTRFLPLSAKSDAALREHARQYLSWLDEHPDELADMAWTAAVGRSHFSHRAGLAFHDADSLREGLAALAEEAAPPTRRKAAKVAFAYTGQASQWPGMGAALYASEPVFRAVLDRCDALLSEDRGGASLLDVMFGRPGAAGDLDDLQWKPPAIYALECALAALWESLGIRPDVVLGHSLGEIAAAQTAGVFSMQEGLRFAAARGSLIGALPGEGAMAAVFAPPARVAEAVAAQNAATGGPGLSVAADNGAHQVVSGPVADIEAILARFEANELRVARLRKSPAYHSAMIEPALGDLEAAISTIAFQPPSATFVSNLTGLALEAGEAPDAAYWRRQAREPVAFRACIETLAELGVDAVIEIGPHAVLGPMTTMAWPETAGHAPAVLSSLQRPAKDEAPPAAGSGGGFVEAVAGAYEADLPIRFEGLFAGEERRRIALQVGDEHVRLFRRMLEMQARAGVLEQAGDGFVVTVASGAPLPEGLADDPDDVVGQMAARYAHGTTEIGLFRRSAAALPDVLQGRMGPLTLLFSSGEPTAADLYLKAPVARAANRPLADAVAALLAGMPDGRRLRAIEVGAGTGSATAALLPELPDGRYDYVYTDISAGFFSEAESRFGGAEASIDYRVLDVEQDPVEQGFDLHGYDLVIASNVLHATRYLNETLAHCLALLAPSGQLVALENLRGQGWLDLTFGQLDGWCALRPSRTGWPCRRSPAGRWSPMRAAPSTPFRWCRSRGNRWSLARSAPQSRPSASTSGTCSSQSASSTTSWAASSAAGCWK